MNQDDVVRLLLKYKADINLQDEKGRTPLMEACSAGNIDVIDVLLARGCDINKQDSMGCTALMRVCYAGFDELIQILLRHGANKDIIDKDGHKAYDYYTIKSNNKELLDALV